LQSNGPPDTVVRRRCTPALAARAHGVRRPNLGRVRSVSRPRRALAALGALASAIGLPRNSAAEPALLPRPRAVAYAPGCAVPASRILGGLGGRPGAALVRERWGALGIAAAAGAIGTRVLVGGRGAPVGSEAYRLVVDRGGVRVVAADAEGGFDALATLAQLVERGANGAWRVPCATIADAPALRWRILSDDVSRGPLPTMPYFQERIRTIAGLKMNGYSPYMEHVFASPGDPLPAPLDGITPAELSELARYAARYSVALIPEQQTFAHMHETLKVERYAPLAELPHGYLLTPANPAGEAYAERLISAELAAVPDPPFFHIGSDEPSDLGRGVSAPLVTQRGLGSVYAAHVKAVADLVIARGGGARPLVWDDALARHPELFGELPKQLVFVNWHYGSEATYRPYIDRIARGGFEQLVAPGALNWNAIYPDLDAALPNEDRFITEGKAAGVLGLFQTVWHDDGETLDEATWEPVALAAAAAWQTVPVDRATFGTAFARAFFGTDDAGYAADLAALGRCGTLVRHNPREYGDYLFWSDPFDPTLRDLGARVDLRALRLAAEDVTTHLRTAPAPPLHAEAALAMRFAAERYDALGREYQIAAEARADYDDARAHVASGPASVVERELFLTKYLFWEQRDAMLGLVPEARATWEYENRASHEGSVLERYRAAADRAIERGERISRTVYADYLAKHELPTFDRALGLETEYAP